MKLITPGLVIRSSEYRDYDRMITIITPEHGKIDANARGCRRLKSPIANSAELFTAGEYTLYSRDGRYTVEQCRITESFYPIRCDYDKLIHAVYWLRLLDTFVQSEEECGDIFMLALRSLSLLAFTDLPNELLTFCFEMRMLAIGGIAPGVDTCTVCLKPLTGEARFDIIRGGATCPACSKAALISIEARRHLWKIPRTQPGYEEKIASIESWKEAAHHCRAFLDYRLELKKEYYPPLP